VLDRGGVAIERWQWLIPLYLEVKQRKDHCSEKRDEVKKENIAQRPADQPGGTFHSWPNFFDIQIIDRERLEKLTKDLTGQKFRFSKLQGSYQGRTTGQGSLIADTPD